MQKEKGMGRTRLTRFAAVTVPAVVAVAGLGVAIVQGSVGAVLSSANGFQMASAQIKTDSLKLRNGEAATAASSTNTATIFTETGQQTVSNGVNILANATLPVLGEAWLQMKSTDPAVSLPGVILNAKTLTTTNANGAAFATSMTNVDMGIAQSAANFADTSAADGYSANDFALTSGAATLNNLAATAYAIHLNGLSLQQLSLGVGLGAGSL